MGDSPRTSGKNESENDNFASDESKRSDKNKNYINSHNLRIAAKNDNSDRIKELLYEGADLETLKKEATNNKSGTIRELSRNVPDLQTALFQCVAEKDPESIVVLLLNYEGNKENLEEDCITLTINLAAQLGHYEIIDEIAHFLIQSEYVSGDFPKDFNDCDEGKRKDNENPSKDDEKPSKDDKKPSKDDEKPTKENGKLDEVDGQLKKVMLQSQIAISRFRVLSSPVYMSLRYLKDEEINNEKDEEKEKENGEEKEKENGEEKEKGNGEEKQKSEEEKEESEEEKKEEKKKENEEQIKERKKNPLTYAYALNEKIQQRAKDEPEFKKEYLHLSERCKTFVTDLYKCCGNMEEILALLDIDKEELEGDNIRGTVKEIFKKAIKNNHKEFVAHPNSQQLLNTAIYSGVPMDIRIITSPLLNTLLFIVYTICFPLLALLYHLYSHNWLSIMMETPYLKFVSHVSQFLVFLILVAASALRSSHIPSGLEYVIFVIVIAMTVQEIREMWHHQPRRAYFFKWWNIVTIVMLTLYILGALLWIIGYAITGGWSIVIDDYSLTKFAQPTDGYQLLLLGNSVFSLAIVVSVFHLVDLCQVNSVLGPLQLSLYRMLRDVLKFLVFFLAIFVAFVMGVRNLYSYYSSIQSEIVANHVNMTVVVETNHPFSTFSRSTGSMFWALFDQAELEDFNTKDTTFEITQETGKLLFAFYSICIIMVALNMLIATMTHSYDCISEDVDIQWKFLRTQLWLEFIAKGSIMPAPYNLLPNLGAFCCSLTGKYRGYRHNSTVAVHDSEKRKPIVKRLVRRYFGRQESQRKEETATLKDIEEIIKILKENQAAHAKS